MSFSPFFAYLFLFMKGAHPSIQARTCLKIDCCAAELLFDIPFLPCIYFIEPAANSPSRRFLFFIFVVFFHSREIFIQSFHHLFNRPEARNF
ncbi:hypothetical protein T09_4915 [Trichinella sp. T9]|nr:hypothetical protein T09_4915 [Trichinella sp. T9]